MSDTKALRSVEIKDADEGTVEAVFSVFNVKDHDNDVTLPGAFEDGAKVRISAYGHSSWGPSRGASSVPQPPVGKGVIRVSGDEALLDGQFFLKTQAGRDHFELVKEMEDLQEWSYGYDIKDSEIGDFEGEKVRFLKSMVVHEVSPVLLGAGVGTRTVAVKGKQLDSDLREALQEAGTARYGAPMETYVWVDDIELDEGWVVYCVSSSGDDEYRKVGFSRDGGTTVLGDVDEAVERTTSYTPKSLKFSAHIESVVADFERVVGRSADVLAMRSEKSKGLSDESRELLKRLDDSATRLREVLASGPPGVIPTDAALIELARFGAISGHHI